MAKKAAKLSMSDDRAAMLVRVRALIESAPSDVIEPETARVRVECGIPAWRAYKDKVLTLWRP